MLISLLGPLEVRTDDDVPVDPGGAKQRAVLAQLSRKPNIAVSADHLAEGVWGVSVPPRYRQNLQVYVSTLRRLLEPNRPGKAPSRIAGHREAYELVAGDDEIDVRRFDVLLHAGRAALAEGRPDAAASHLRNALALWRGEPLADLADQPFAAAWTTELLQKRIDAEEERIRADLACGHSAQLVPELSDLVQQNPERESFWEQLMLALYRCGRQSEALETFRTARDRLLEESGLDPGPALARMADAVLNHDPDLLALAPITSEARNVPVPLTAVVGGAREVATVMSLIERGERLIVMTGPGGVGKTRLALAAAPSVEAIGSRVVWVPLEDVTTTEQAAARVAHHRGVNDLSAGGRSSARKDLLLLDNLEQIPGVGAMIKSLLEAQPSLQLLATSRSALGVPGENVVQVNPLDLASAVELFASRARAVDPSLDIELCRPAVERVCAALDGLPLAVELASARVNVFTPDELAAELVRDPRSLDTVQSEGRQGSVSGLVTWSLDLLSRPARALMARLAACPGSVDLETAAAAGVAAGLSAEDTKRAVAELVRGALLRSVEGAEGRRFIMLNVVRSVAGVDLSVEECNAVFRQIADLFVARARRLAPWVEPDGARLAAARADLALTRWVIDYLVRSGLADDAAVILCAGLRTYTVLGRADEAMRMLVRLLEDGNLSEGARPAVSVAAGSAAYKCSNPRATELLSAVDALDDSDYPNQVLGLTALCARLADAGEAELAAARARDALQAAEISKEPALQMLAHSAWGWAAIRRGAFREAAEHGRAQLTLATSDEDAALALTDVALAELFQENTQAALDAAAEALAVARRQGPGRPVAMAQQQLGYALVQGGDGSGGAAMLSAALSTVPEDHDVGFTLETAAAVGLAACLAGYRSEGKNLIRRANAVADRLYPGELAVIEPLRGTGARHQIDIAREASITQRVPAVAEVRTEAVTLGKLIADRISDGGARTTI